MQTQHNHFTVGSEAITHRGWVCSWLRRQGLCLIVLVSHKMLSWNYTQTHWKLAADVCIVYYSKIKWMYACDVCLQFRVTVEKKFNRPLCKRTALFSCNKENWFWTSSTSVEDYVISIICSRRAADCWVLTLLKFVCFNFSPLSLPQITVGGDLVSQELA